jgi:hypothetical protein
MRRGLILLLIAMLALGAGGCGKKGKLSPRNQLPLAEGDLPPQWRAAPAPAEFGRELGVDGLLEPEGEPERLEEKKLSPTPAPAIKDLDRSEEDTDDEETKEE